MTLEINPLHKLFGAEIIGADLTQSLDDAIFAEIRDAFETYSVIVLRGPVITDEQQIALSDRFGEIRPAARCSRGKATSISRPGISFRRIIRG
jgi:alpha-ketoglutarate-dependent 2,4-dichlorophenoxyacetate dioxygenase